jgi:hypothetical protein
MLSEKRLQTVQADLIQCNEELRLTCRERDDLRLKLGHLQQALVDAQDKTGRYESDMAMIVKTMKEDMKQRQHKSPAVIQTEVISIYLALNTTFVYF